MRLPLLAGILLGCSTSGLISCGTKGDRKEQKAIHFLDPVNIDSSVRPNDNFFLFANGNWLKRNPIPPSETTWGSLDVLEEHNLQVQHELLEQAAEQALSSRDPDLRKLGDFYHSAMDTQRIEQAGITPLTPLLSRISRISGADGVWNEILLEHTEGFSTAFTFYVAPDDGNTRKHICRFYQGGLGMPEAGLYVASDKHSEEIRKAYRTYIISLFRLRGDAPAVAEQHAIDVLEIESELARHSMSRPARMAVQQLYHKFSLRAADSLTPGLSWAGSLQRLHVPPGQDSFVIGQPDFYVALARQLQKQPVDRWKVYLGFHAMNAMAPYLGHSFVQAHFTFYSRKIKGQAQPGARWKFALQVMDGFAGELLGKLYVARTFKPEAKKKMSDLVDNIQQTYKERIMRSAWMSAATRKKAVQKLNAITKKIGYPEQTHDYSGLRIVRSDFARNILAASAFQYSKNLARLTRPVDKDEWNINAATVNACYNIAFNEIIFPAGILQYSFSFQADEPLQGYDVVLSRNRSGHGSTGSGGYKIILPFSNLQYPYFIEDADDAVNYGSIGTFIAHEMTHGFDNRGRYYDADGNLNNWWTTDDEQRFQERAKVLIGQFNAYTVLDTVLVNGSLTLGENIADLGGISIAYEAFKKTRQGKSRERIDGFTPDQRFFLSWAQVWRASSTDAEVLNRIKSDHHAPYMWRCNGPLSNMPEFYQAFGIRPGDRMYREPSARAAIW